MRQPLSTLIAATVAAAFSLASLTHADEPVSIEDAPIEQIGGITPMFDGMTSGVLSAKLIMKDAMHGHLLLQNLTDEPLNVSIPEAFGGQQVLGQGFGGGFGGGGGGLGGGGGGGAQTTAGGNSGADSGGDTGFFSIAPQKIKSVAYKSVCMEHGKTEPMSKMTYVPVPLEEVTQDPALQELVKGVAKSPRSTQAMQAAAWHLTDNMSWKELAAKKYNAVGRPDTPYFTRAELLMAMEIVAESRRRAEAAKNAANRL